MFIKSKPGYVCLIDKLMIYFSLLYNVDGEVVKYKISFLLHFVVSSWMLYYEFDVSLRYHPLLSDLLTISLLFFLLFFFHIFMIFDSKIHV